MILKGGAVGGGGLGRHLEAEENEKVEVVQAEGLFSRDIAGAVAELRARGTGITPKPVFHVAISAAPGAKWDEAEQRQAVAALLKEYGAEGLPHFVVRHTKDAQGVGRDPHLHVVWTRIDDRGRVISDSFSRIRNEKVARCLEYDLGHPLTVGKHNKAVMTALKRQGRPEVAAWMDGAGAGTAPRPTAHLTHAESQQQRRTGITKAQAGAEVLAAWRASDCGTAFRAALARAGYQLAKGREGGIMVVDPAGGSHELTRLLRAAMKAEGDKRPAKEVRAQIDARTADLDRATLPDLAEVVAEARQGLDPEPGAPGAAGAPPAEVPTADAILERLTWDRATFTEAELDRELRQVRDKGERADLKAEILARADVLTVALDENGGRRLTTIAMAEIEAGVLDRSEALTLRRTLAVDRAKAEAGLAEFRRHFYAQTGHQLMDEQAGGILHVTTGADLANVTGSAGAGKSTMMEGAARIWTAAGLRVEGMALSGVAAARLAESGITSDTIAARLGRWDRVAALSELRRTGAFTDASREAVLRALDAWTEAAEKRGERTDGISDMRHQVDNAGRLDHLDRRTRRWLDRWIDRQARQDIDSRTVLVIDEAGMVNHRLMNRILAHAHRVGAKVVAVGDAEQIQPIEAGAAFRLMQRIARPAELREVIRQSEKWQRQATKDFASGDPARAAGAVMAYAQRGYVTAGIRGVGDPATLYAEAAEKLGRHLTDQDRTQIDRMAAYVGARVEAGALWREIEAAKGDPKAHPLYGAFREAQERRNQAVQDIARDLDAARPWLARYGVSAEGFAADLGYAEGKPRAAAEDEAAERAEALGLVDIEADVKLSFDWRGAARLELFENWRRDLQADGLTRADGKPLSRIILAYTRADVARLNADARQVMRQEGHLTGPDTIIKTEIDGEAGTLALAVGDRLMTLANDKRIGVMNGTTGRVVEIGRNDAGAVVVTMATDDGRRVEIDTAEYRALAHGFAATLHRSQGVTVDRAWMLHYGSAGGRNGIDRHLAYVGMSRHRQFVRTYAAAIDAPTAEALARQYSRGRTKDAISDHVDARRLLRDPAGVLLAMRQSIGVAASQVRELGERLDAAASKIIARASRQVDAAGAALAKATTKRTTKEKRHVSKPYRSRAYGLPNALRQFDADPAAQGSTAEAIDRLHAVPRLSMAGDTGGSAVLLPRDAGHVVDQQEARADGGLRRAGVGAGRGGIDPALFRFVEAHERYTAAMLDHTTSPADRQALRIEAQRLARDVPAEALAKAPAEVKAAAEEMAQAQPQHQGPAPEA